MKTGESLTMISLCGKPIIMALLTIGITAIFILGCLSMQGASSSTDVSDRTVSGSASVRTVVFHAPSVGREMRFALVLPDDYDLSDESYPVLYLLHGYGATYMQWVDYGVPEYAAAYDLVVVMPDAGNSSYVNWAVSEDGQKNDWEDYIIKDLVGYVDDHYRTIPRRAGRAISGLSMGGNSATVLGLLHPEMFCSIASHSGAQGGMEFLRERLLKGEPVSPVPERPDWIGDFDIPGFGTYMERSPKGQIVSTIEEADSIDAMKLILQVPADALPDIYIDCGTDDFLFERFKALTKLMRDNEITHTARVCPGGHTREYWTENVRLSMAHQYQIIKAALARSSQ